tara:strand:- start:93 stop:194 length:102 start_codon:yes stop_codon:yes gene_type:complete
MNNKGFFGYGRCPHSDAFLKEKERKVLFPYGKS